MKKIIFTLFFGLILSNLVHAEEAQSHEIKIGEFTDLKITNSINVIYSNNPDSLGYAQFRCDKSIVPAIMFSNNNKGKITIEVADENINSAKLPTIYMYSSFLKSVENAADSTVRIVGKVSAPELKFKTTANGTIIANDIEANTVGATIFTGKGNIVLKGKTTNANYNITGTGQITANDLIATDVSCWMAGTGNLKCYSSRDLTIKGTGSSTVYYAGNPGKVKTYKIGKIKAIPLETKK